MPLVEIDTLPLGFDKLVRTASDFALAAESFVSDAPSWVIKGETAITTFSLQLAAPLLGAARSPAWYQLWDLLRIDLADARTETTLEARM